MFFVLFSLQLLAAPVSPFSPSDTYQPLAEQEAQTAVEELYLAYAKVLGETWRSDRTGRLYSVLTSAEREALARNAFVLKDASGNVYRTVRGRPLLFYIIEPQKEAQRTAMLLGGVHADEIAAGFLSIKSIAQLLTGKRELPTNTRIVAVLAVNPDSMIDPLQNTRIGDRIGTHNHPRRNNAANQDINRHFSISPEYDQHMTKESRFVNRLIAKFTPSHIVAPHAPFGFLDPDFASGISNDKKEEVFEWLRRVSRANNNRVKYSSRLDDTLGKPLPHPSIEGLGSLGYLATYAPKYFGLVSLTYELPCPKTRFAEPRRCRNPRVRDFWLNALLNIAGVVEALDLDLIQTRNKYEKIPSKRIELR